MKTELEYRVPGMTCDHCVRAITSEVEAVEGVKSVTIDLATKAVTVVGESLDDATVKAAIVEAGYELERSEAAENLS